MSQAPFSAQKIDSSFEISYLTDALFTAALRTCISIAQIKVQIELVR